MPLSNCKIHTTKVVKYRIIEQKQQNKILGSKNWGIFGVLCTKNANMQFI